MSRLDRDTLRRMIIEEVAQARKEAVRPAAGLTRERLRQIIMEEVSAVKRDRLMGEWVEARTPKLSLVAALLGEADDKGSKAPAKAPAKAPVKAPAPAAKSGKMVFEDGGKGTVKVGKHLYRVMSMDPDEVRYVPDFKVNTASKVVVRPDAVAAYFSGGGAVSASSMGIMSKNIDWDRFQVGVSPENMDDLMAKLANGTTKVMLPLKQNDAIVYFVEKTHYDRIVKDRSEDVPYDSGDEDEDR